MLDILERFPGTRAEEYARQEINKLMSIITDEQGAHILDVEEENEVVEEEDTVAVPEGETLNETSPASNEAENEIPAAMAGTADSDGRGGSPLASFVMAGAILALALAAFVGAKGLQWMKKPGGN